MTLAGAWPLLKVLAIFAAMVAGIRLRLGLAWSILAGAMLLGVCFRLTPWGVVMVAAGSFAAAKTLLIATEVWLILVFSDLLAASGQSERILASLSGYLTWPRLRLVFFPALIGFLPMPGGAIFSAPLMDAVSGPLGVKPLDRAVINYWFRHIWELICPLYPGILLAASLTGLPFGHIVARTLPGALAFTALGWFFLLRPGALALPDTPAVTQERAPVIAALVQGLPLLVAVFGSLGLELALEALAPSWPAELAILTGLLAAMALLAMQNRLGPAMILGRAFSRRHGATLGVVAAIFVFKDVMAAAGVVDDLSRTAGGHVALLAAAVPLPFLVGMVSGITMAFVGATVPLLMGVLAELGRMDQLGSFVTLNLFSGFLGVISSPLHICLILSCDYFGAGMGAALGRLARPCLGFLVFTAGYVALLFVTG